MKMRNTISLFERTLSPPFGEGLHVMGLRVAGQKSLVKYKVDQFQDGDYHVSWWDGRWVSILWLKGDDAEDAEVAAWMAHSILNDLPVPGFTSEGATNE